MPAHALAAKAKGSDGASLILPSLLSSLNVSIRRHWKLRSGDLIEVTITLWHARGWDRLGFERTEPGLWWTRRVGPMVLACRVVD